MQARPRFWSGSCAGSAERREGPARREGLTGSHWGAIRIKVESGRLTGIRAWERDPRPSGALQGVLESVYSPTRIKYPMVCRAWLEHAPGADPAGRGDGDSVRVTWDHALDLVAAELQRVDKAHGPGGSFAGSYGWKSQGKLHNCRTLLQRMMQLKGGFMNASGDYSAGASQMIMPYVVGSVGVYEQCAAWPVVAAHTALMVFWGAYPVNNYQISWTVADHGAYPGLEALRAEGTKTICIDPVRTETCAMLNAEWIAPRPQTDIAMMLGIAHTLFIEKLHDAAFLARYTTGFDKFEFYLTGESDGVPETAAWAEAICGIPAKRRCRTWRAASPRAAPCSPAATRFSASIMASSRIGCWSRWRACWARSARPGAATA